MDLAGVRANRPAMVYVAISRAASLGILIVQNLQASMITADALALAEDARLRQHKMLVLLSVPEPITSARLSYGLNVGTNVSQADEQQPIKIAAHIAAHPTLAACSVILLAEARGGNSPQLWPNREMIKLQGTRGIVAYISRAVLLFYQACYTAAGVDTSRLCLQPHSSLVSDMVCVLAVYRSPSQGQISDVKTGVRHVLQQLPSCAKIIILGDFNMDLSTHAINSAPLLQDMLSPGPQQLMVGSTTYANTTIDHCYSSITDHTVLSCSLSHAL